MTAHYIDSNIGWCIKK